MRRTIDAAAVRIRPMVMADIPSIIAIDNKITDKNRASTWETNVGAYLQGGPALCRVAAVDGEVVGFILGDIKGWDYGIPEGGWIDIMGVDPDYQGMGIGKQLVNSFVEHCSKAGKKKIHALVKASDEKTKTFFQSIDFHQGELIDIERNL